MRESAMNLRSSCNLQDEIINAECFFKEKKLNRLGKPISAAWRKSSKFPERFSITPENLIGREVYEWEYKHKEHLRTVTVYPEPRARRVALQGGPSYARFNASRNTNQTPHFDSSRVYIRRRWKRFRSKALLILGSKRRPATNGARRNDRSLVYTRNNTARETWITSCRWQIPRPSLKIVPSRRF